MLNAAQLEAASAPLNADQKKEIDRMMANLATADDPIVQNLLATKPDATRELCTIVARLAEAMRLEDPVDRSPKLPPAEAARMRRRMGLDEPVSAIVRRGNTVEFGVMTRGEVATRSVPATELEDPSDVTGDDRPRQLPPDEWKAMRRRMGLDDGEPAIQRSLTGRRVSFGIMSREKACLHSASLAAEDAEKGLAARRAERRGNGRS